MISFRDRKGQAWTRRIDVDAAVRMRELSGLDVMAIVAEESVSQRLAGADAEASAEIADALYCLFLPDAQAIGVHDRAFGKRLRGVKADELRDLFFEGVTAFFRMPGPVPKTKGDRNATADELWQDIYRLAGEACVAPGPHTYGELAVMAVGRRRLEWAQTATLRADIINSNAFRRGTAVNPADLDPTGGLKETAKPEGMEITPDAIDVLAKVFMGRG